MTLLTLQYAIQIIEARLVPLFAGNKHGGA
jgi:hypothetical protein